MPSGICHVFVAAAVRLWCPRHIPARVCLVVVSVATQQLLHTDVLICCPLQVVELIWITVDPGTCVPNPEMTGLAQLLVGRVMALRPRFSVALHKAIAGVRPHALCMGSSKRQTL